MHAGTGDIGGRLRGARRRLGWTREALAYRAGLSWSAIEQIESRRRKNITLKTLSALSSALGVSIDYLVEGAASAPTMLRHAGLCYGSQEEFLASTAPFLEEGIERDEAALAVTSRQHIDLLREILGRNARRVDFAEAMQWYRAPVAALEAYRSFIKERVDAGVPWVRVVGEPLWRGQARHRARVCARSESIINLGFNSSPATILCCYDKRSVGGSIVTEAKHTHPEIVKGARAAENPSYRSPEVFLLEPGP